MALAHERACGRFPECLYSGAVVSVPRGEPAKKGPPNQPGGDARAAALGTYQMRVDAQLRQEPRFGSPSGATIK